MQEKDQQAYYSPDLHYNKATVSSPHLCVCQGCLSEVCISQPLPLIQLCKYLEEFGPALAGYRLSAALDPEWGTPGEQADALAQHLQLFHQLIQDKVGAWET